MEIGEMIKKKKKMRKARFRAIQRQLAYFLSGVSNTEIKWIEDGWTENKLSQEILPVNLLTLWYG